MTNNSGFQQTILIVEDNPHHMQISSEYLTLSGYRVLEADNLTKGRALFLEERPNLIVLDVMLPDGNGLRLCEELRKGSQVPILFLSAKKAHEDMLAGFHAGGDDYLTKPFSFDELAARVKSLLRRAEQLPDKITKGALTLLVSSNEAFVNGIDIGIGKDIEFSLLCYFVQNEDAVLSHEQIYQKVWGKPLIDNAHALKSAVKRLRQKIKGSGYTISSEYGTGFKFEKGET